MSRIADLLPQHRLVVSIGSESTVLEAIQKMVEHNIGSVLILDGGRIVGIFTERDVLHRVALRGLAPARTPVRDVMTARLIYLEPHCSIEECMAVMTNERVRHLPIVDGGDLVGVISIGDVVKHLSAQKEFEVRVLTDYIGGRYPG